jgi:molybdopterin/thiamine biosynthesis adenylyltransferase
VGIAHHDAKSNAKWWAMPTLLGELQGGAFEMNDALFRYHRQMLLTGIAEQGQRRLADATVLIAGCGGLGCVAADMLARAGVGHLKIVDRDFIEITNLQRQVLYDEQDVEAGLPKAEAARRRINAVNSQIKITAIVDDINHTNAETLAAECDVIVDGLDSFETRYLLNDVAVKHSIPYVYGGAVGDVGAAYTILPHADPKQDASQRSVWELAGAATPCLRCIFEQMPPPGASPTCDTAGVLGPIVAIIGNYEAAETIKIITRNWDAINRSMINIDIWDNQFHQLNVTSAYEAGRCPCCKQRRFEFIEGKFATAGTALCGSNAVQLTQMFKRGQGPNFDLLADRLKHHGPVKRNAFMLRATFNDGGSEYELTLFNNGRAIIKGTHDPRIARSIFAKYVGT